MFGPSVYTKSKRESIPPPPIATFLNNSSSNGIGSLDVSFHGPSAVVPFSTSIFLTRIAFLQLLVLPPFHTTTLGQNHAVARALASYYILCFMINNDKLHNVSRTSISFIKMGFKYHLQYCVGTCYFVLW